jgi:hypothetical protein
MSASTKANANPFSFTTMLALVLVGVVCMAGIALLSAYEPELKSGNDGQAHPLSKSSVGYLALTRLLDKTGIAVDLNRQGIDEDYDYSTVILTPRPGVAGDEILDFYREGPTIIILPKWYVGRDKNKRGWSQLLARLPKDMTLDILPADLQGESKLLESAAPLNLTLKYTSPITDEVTSFGTTKPISGLRSLTGSRWLPVVAGPDGSAVIAKRKDTNVYVVADPDILNNAGIAGLANARLIEHFLLDISEDEEGPIVFDLTLNGFQRQPNLGRLMLEPPLLGATLCFVLASILIGLQAAVRFLPPKEQTRVVALGKRALADNTAGLIRMGRREHRMSLPYANVLKRLVIKAIGAPANLDPVAQTTMLDRVSELSDSQLRYSTLLGEAGAATSPQELIKVAKDLHRWKQETTRERQ